jgi:hypothetical protein
MSKRTLILGFIGLSCVVQTANAVNDRTQKLLEAQSLNAPPAKTSSQKAAAAPNVNARPNTVPTHGVFDPPVAVGTSAGKVPAVKR